MDQTQGTQGPWEWWSPPVACAAPCRSLHCNWTRRKFARCNRHARSRPHISHPPRKPRPGRPGLLRYFNQLCCFMLLITIYIYKYIYPMDAMRQCLLNLGQFWLLHVNARQFFSSIYIWWLPYNFVSHIVFHTLHLHIMGVSIKNVPQNGWFIYNAKILFKWMIWGHPHKLRKLHIWVGQFPIFDGKTSSTQTRLTAARSFASHTVRILARGTSHGTPGKMQRWIQKRDEIYQMSGKKIGNQEKSTMLLHLFWDINTT